MTYSWEEGCRTHRPKYSSCLIVLKYNIIMLPESNFRINMCFFMCIYTAPPHEQEVTQGQLLTEFNRFEFRSFFLLEWLPYQG